MIAKTYKLRYYHGDKCPSCGASRYYEGHCSACGYMDQEYLDHGH